MDELQEPVQEEQVIPEQPIFDEEEIKKAFTDLLRSARDEDRWLRDEQIRALTRLEYYWENILDIFMDPVSRNWQVPNWEDLGDELPPRLINIFRPHGEAIVAALSVTIPSLIFHPDDAENVEDIEEAKTRRNIVDLLQLHNDAPMLWIRALVIIFCQGTIFGYNYELRDKRFGTFRKPQIETQDVTVQDALCPECGEFFDEYEGGAIQCQTCGYVGEPELSESVEKLPQIIGFTQEPKASVCQELYSAKNIKIPAYVKKQEECGYLLLEFQQSTAMLRNLFKEKAEAINGQRYSNEETFSRLPIQYYGDVPDNSSLVSCLWVRPWQFWQLGVEKRDLIDHLQKTYPDGCYAVFIDEEYMEAYPEDMDEHWTIAKNPLGETLYSRPLSENLATVQDIRANLVEIEVQTAEHGIPETFVDPKVLDLKKYGQGVAKPGSFTNASARPGHSLSDGFFTNKPAILSQEIDPLRAHIDQDAQFVVGSFPSVYGGPAIGGSKTASEYSQSRSVALQRLGLYWKILNSFWAAFQNKSAAEYVRVLKEQGRDEKFTIKSGDSFFNKRILLSSLNGQIGRVEPESSEQLPSSWAQNKDTIMMLLQAGIPEIIGTLTHPKNAELMKKATGLKDFYIPGSEDVTRQNKEFILLAQGVPVPTNEFIDNDELHVMILQGLLEGEQGEMLSPEGRQACMMHLGEHLQRVMANAAMDEEAESSPDKQQEKKQNVPSE